MQGALKGSTSFSISQDVFEVGGGSEASAVGPRTLLEAVSGFGAPEPMAQAAVKPIEPKLRLLQSAGN